MLNDLIAYLEKEKIAYEKNVSMKNHTTFKTGGAADVFAMPENTDELIAVLKKSKEFGVRSFILGNGSNILVSDRGIEGVVVDMSAISGITVEGEEIVCMAGESLRKLCLSARDNSLSGLQFAYGIPGTVGGAFYMNAGAYGGEMKDVAKSALCLDKDYNVITLSAKDMQLGYRTSAFKTKGYIILSVTVALNKGDKTIISEQMDEIFKRRVDKQPLDYPSAGSTFKRPEGYYAGALIEGANLKGAACGGAMVSKKHAGFIINYDNATTDDILSLIKTVKERVKENSGVTLEEEVLFVGRR